MILLLYLSPMEKGDVNHGDMSLFFPLIFLFSLSLSLASFEMSNTLRLQSKHSDKTKGLSIHPQILLL